MGLSKNFEQIFVIIIVGFILEGCGTQEYLKKLHYEAIKAQAKIHHEPLKENEGIVFGSLVFRCYDSEENSLDRNEREISSPTLFITKSDNVHWDEGVDGRLQTTFTAGWKSRKVLGSLKLSGMVFSEVLPAGEYSIYKMNFPSKGTTYSYHRSDIRFTVVANQVTYIGSLNLDLYFKDSDSRYVNKTRTAVKDKQIDDSLSFKRENPNLIYEIEKDLMIVIFF